MNISSDKLRTSNKNNVLVSSNKSVSSIKNNSYYQCIAGKAARGTEKGLKNKMQHKNSYYFNINLLFFSLIARYRADARGYVYKNIRYVGPRAAPSRAFGPQTERK